MRGQSALVDNLPPLCPLASRVVARGNKPADIVISPRSSDAGASLNQSGPGTCKRRHRLVATNLCSPRLTVYQTQVRRFIMIFLSIFPHVYFQSIFQSMSIFNRFVSFPSMSIFNHFMSNLNPLSSFSSCLISITDVYFQSLCLIVILSCLIVITFNIIMSIYTPYTPCL